MRRNTYGAWILWTICGGCGASTGLPDGSSDSSLGSAPGNSTGGEEALGGYPVAQGGAFGTGGAWALTGGAAYYFTGGSKATGGYPYYYSGGAKASGGSYYYAGGTKATGGYTYSYAGGAKASGGSSYSYAGGTKATGGYTYSYAGGAKASGGSSYSYAGGAKASGGSSYSYAGGTKATGGATGTGGTRPTGAMKIGTDGYVSMAAGMYLLHGYVGSFEGGSGSSNQLTYGTNNICASGIVASNPNYISYAGIGINVNQNSASSTNPSTGSLAIDATNITVSFSNDYQSQLRLQLNDSAGNNWCYDITGYSSPVTIPLSSFNTRCWDNSGDPFKPGTAITSLSLVVPGDATSDRKFSFCFYSVYFS